MWKKIILLMVCYSLLLLTQGSLNMGVCRFFFLMLTKTRQISQALWLCLPVENRDNWLLKVCLHLLSYCIHALEDGLIFFDLALDISFSFSKFPRGISLGVEESNCESYILLSTLCSLSLLFSPSFLPMTPL